MNTRSDTPQTSPFETDGRHVVRNGVRVATCKDVPEAAWIASACNRELAASSETREAFPVLAVRERALDAAAHICERKASETSIAACAAVLRVAAVAIRNLKSVPPGPSQPPRGPREV